jgi:hypothetical protein
VTRLTLGLLALAAAALPSPALACKSGCPGSSGTVASGGTPLPAPAGVAFLALGATLLLTRRRRA